MERNRKKRKIGGYDLTFEKYKHQRNLKTRDCIVRIEKERQRNLKNIAIK